MKGYLFRSLLFAFLASTYTYSAVADPAAFDTTIGKWGLDEEQKYHGEQLPRAKSVVDNIDPEEVKHHPYYEGTDDLMTAIKNWTYDSEVIEHSATYEECLDYKKIGLCLTIKDNKVDLTNYVTYYGPWQKGEEVPEPFRTGYFPEEMIKPIKKELLKTYYSEFMPDVIKHQLDYSLGITSSYLSRRTGSAIGMTGPVPTPDQKVIDATKEAALARGENQLGESSPIEHGFVFNEYHLMPAKSSVYELMKAPASPDFKGFCHAQKFPLLWASEAPGMNVYSRYSEQSQLLFPTEMAILRNDPLNCIGFNVRTGLTPNSLAGLSLTSLGSPCQGVNQGAWVPVTNKVHTLYQTTAAAIGLTRSRVANRVMPFSFYDIDPKVDKVQWIRNDRMDGEASMVPGAGAGGTVTPKKCVKLEKFVLDYDRGNLKIGPEEGLDHWNVLAHWRKIRCCPLGGLPVLITVPGSGETLVPILQ